jgi:hypothetical protein
MVQVREPDPRPMLSTMVPSSSTEDTSFPWFAPAHRTHFRRMRAAVV